MSGTIRIPVDVTNPGQFFACCGLLELADRLWAGVEGSFCQNRTFALVGVPTGASIESLLESLPSTVLTGALTPDLDKERDELEREKRELKKLNKSLVAAKENRRKELGNLLRSGAMTIDSDFRLRLDWWQEDSDEVPKTWAGSMQVRRVALAALGECTNAFKHGRPFEYPCVLRPVDEDSESADGDEDAEGKAEPFYFDSNRGTNATPLDIGFSPNKLSVTRTAASTTTGRVKTRQVKMESMAFPAIEFFALIGLQRFRPMPTVRPRVFVYRAWAVPLPPSVAAAAASGLLPGVGGDLYQFENAFRTDQRKHKGFLPATRITEGDTP